jgi:hypothetical protein
MTEGMALRIRRNLDMENSIAELEWEIDLFAVEIDLADRLGGSVEETRYVACDSFAKAEQSVKDDLDSDSDYSSYQIINIKRMGTVIIPIETKDIEELESYYSARS